MKKYSSLTTQELLQIKKKGNKYNIFLTVVSAVFIASLVFTCIVWGFYAMLAVGLSEFIVLIILVMVNPYDAIDVELELQDRHHYKTKSNVRYNTADTDKMIKENEQLLKEITQQREKEKQAKNQKALENIVGLYLIDKALGGHLFGK